MAHLEAAHKEAPSGAKPAAGARRAHQGIDSAQ